MLAVRDANKSGSWSRSIPRSSVSRGDVLFAITAERIAFIACVEICAFHQTNYTQINIINTISLSDAFTIVNVLFCLSKVAIANPPSNCAWFLEISLASSVLQKGNKDEKRKISRYSSSTKKDVQQGNLRVL